MKTIKIGFLGLGTVGSGALRILSGNADSIAKKVGARIEVAKILVRDSAKKRGIATDPLLLTENPGDVIENSDIDIIVEVMGGTQPARDYVLEAMKRGKSIVTANKDMMAIHGKELFSAADEYGTDLLFEGSVGGGIPIIRPLKHCLAANRLQEVIGIINGTTNYMLSKMTAEGSDFADVLREAQQRGYAESDPSADVDGFDAARKLSILASIAFNTRVTLNDVFAEGITRITSEDIAYAKELKYIIKLLGIAKDTGDGVEARVHPCFIPQTHPLASVNDVFNAIFVKGDAVGDVMFFGRGAGDLPTGSAVAADIMEAARNRARGITGISCTCYEDKTIKDIGDIESKYYLRLKVKDRPGVLASIAYALGEKNVSIASVLQKHTDGDMAEIVLVTHLVRERYIQSALKIIEELSAVGEISSMIRVEGD
ncbi:MAG: homoserine dehydrogenase [Peptococcaceae bacterium BICA1-7]|nr:MAG: homoserine dehydrogenase [Peptococcaceae bacterium BICA1-7]HBV96951.1 homoserine dehydrogenase [Desulfotomaculum sp.]